MAYTKTTWITGSTPLSATNMNHIEQGIKDAHDMIAAITETIFPVGSYYETSNSSFNPNGVFAGTWILEKAGQVHVSAGTGYPVAGALTNTSDGGSKDAVVPYHQHSIPALSGTAAETGAHTHTISATETAAGGHTHTITSSCASAGSHNHYAGSMRVDAYGSGNRDAMMGYGYSDNHRVTSAGGAHTHTISSSCSSVAAHSHTITASSASAGGHSHNVSTVASNTGTVGSADNTVNANMQPYINVYRWHRTA